MLEQKIQLPSEISDSDLSLKAKKCRVNAPTMGQLSNFRALKIHNSPHRCDRDLKPTLFCQN